MGADPPTEVVSRNQKGLGALGWCLALAWGVHSLAAAELPCASAESMDGLMTAWTVGFTAQHPDAPARVTLRARYSADFVTPLAKGEVRVAPFARELFASERGQFSTLAGHEPRLVPVAIGSRATKGGTHAIAMFVNARNPIARLSLPQLREVWALDGHITTWGQLGLTGEWAARRITLHGMRVRRATGNPPGIVNFLEHRLLAGRAWRNDVTEYTDVAGGAQSLEQIVRAVAADENAIGYSGFAYALPGAKAVSLAETDAGPAFAGTDEEIAREDYPLTRRIYLCLGPDPDRIAGEFVRFVLSPAGQRQIRADAQGFFPLPPAAVTPALDLLPRPIAALEALPAFTPQPVEFPHAAPYLTPAGAIAIVGYNDMQGIVSALDARFAAAHPEFTFALTLKGTRTAPPALAQGKSALAPMGAEFSAEELAQYRAVVGADPRGFRIAHASLSSKALSGPLAIIVHPDNPLTKLSLPQLKRILKGTAGWKDLGLTGDWAHRAVHPYGVRPELALGLFLRARLGAMESFGPGFKGFPQSADVVKVVADDPLGIGFTAVNRVTSGVKVLALAPDDLAPAVTLTEENVRSGRYPLDRYLLIYARLPLEPWAREYLRMVYSREGQEAVAADALGYLPLNAEEAAAERLKL